MIEILMDMVRVSKMVLTVLVLLVLVIPMTVKCDRPESTYCRYEEDSKVTIRYSQDVFIVILKTRTYID